MSAHTCQTCVYSVPRIHVDPEWFAKHGYNDRECRRNAPTRGPNEDGFTEEAWPFVFSSDSCGNHPERDATLQAARLAATSAIVLAKLMDSNGNELAGRIPAIYGLEAML